MTRLIAFLVALGACLLTQVARGELIRVQLETLGERPPGKVCVISSFSAIKDAVAAPLDAIRAQLSKVLPPGLCDPALNGDFGDDKQVYALSCDVNSGSPVSTRVAVLHLKGASVSKLELDQDTVRLEYLPSTADKRIPASLQLVGGDYHSRSPFPFRQRDGTQLVAISIVPRCVERTATVPIHSCMTARDEPALLSNARVTKPDPAYQPQQVSGSARSLALTVFNDDSGNGKVSLDHCGHRFESEWAGAVPPRTLDLSTTTFQFEWPRTCLAPTGCPDVQVEGVSDVKRVFSGSVPAGVCRYEAKAPARFPVKVRFAYADPTGRRSTLMTWEQTLTSPGLRLSGYVPEEQRRVKLSWNWGEAGTDAQSRANRAAWVSDELSYLEVRTPEGRVHQVPVASEQLRVPELDCDDHLSVRYVGTRGFRERTIPVDESSQVKLPNPADTRADNFSVALGLSGGWRYQRGTGRLSWGPQGEIDAILVWRHLRDALAWKGVGVHIEARAGATLAAQPYCSRLSTDGVSRACDTDDWARVPYWRFPLQVGLNLQLPRGFSIGHGVGFAPTFYHLANDAGRLNRPVLGTIRVHGGYRLTRAISVEFYLRMFWGEQVRSTLFDEAGVLEAGLADGVSSWSFFPGVMLRADDLF